MNVDHAEIEKFNKLSQNWWDKDGEFKTLHDINPCRLNFIEKYVELKGKTVLDVGCGGGILSESMAKKGADVIAIDMAESVIEIAKQHSQTEQVNINYQITSIEEFSEKNKKQFDIITCLELLEHVPDPSSIIQNCAKLLKPNGHLFFSTINRTWQAYLFAIVGAEYALKLLPINTHEYDKFIRPAELVNCLRKNDLSANEIVGLKYNPLNRKCNLTDDVSVNYLVHCSKVK